MLGRRPSGLAGKLREAGLMHTMPTRGIDADRPDMVHTLNEAEQRGRFCGLRHLAQPAEPAWASVRPPLRQCIQPPPLLGGQAVGQPSLDLSPRPKAEINTEAFEAPRCRGHNSPVATENRIRAGADAAMGYPRFGMLDLLKRRGSGRHPRFDPDEQPRQP